MAFDMPQFTIPGEIGSHKVARLRKNCRMTEDFASQPSCYLLPNIMRTYRQKTKREGKKTRKGIYDQNESSNFDLSDYLVTYISWPTLHL